MCLAEAPPMAEEFNHPVTIRAYLSLKLRLKSHWARIRESDQLTIVYLETECVSEIERYISLVYLFISF